MADQSHNPYGFRPLRGTKPVIGHFPIKTGQSLKKGDAVIIDTLQIAIGLAASARLLGFVARDCASLTAGTKVPVWLATPGSLWVGRANDDSSAVGLGSEVDLVGATGAMEIDEDASATDVFKLLYQLNDEEDNTAAGAEWVFIVNKPEIDAID